MTKTLNRRLDNLERTAPPEWLPAEMHKLWYNLDPSAQATFLAPGGKVEFMVALLQAMPPQRREHVLALIKESAGSED